MKTKNFVIFATIAIGMLLIFTSVPVLAEGAPDKELDLDGDGKTDATYPLQKVG